MKREILFFVTILFLAAIIFTSCSKSKSESYDYMPVQLVDSKMWSILNTKTGELMYEDEFDHEPSIIKDNIFFVKNSNGKYDYFNLSDVKKPINKESFCDVTILNSKGYALAVKPGGTICIIDKECNTVKDLGSEIEYCSLPDGGLAPFTRTDGKKGYINDKGDIIIQAKYDEAESFSKEDGIAIVGTKDSEGKIKYEAIDESGKTLFSFSEKEYQRHGIFSEGAISVQVSGEGETDVFFLDRKGKKIGKFGKTDWINFWDYRFVEGATVFNEGEAFGLKDAKGEIIFRAKYNSLFIRDKDLLFAKKDKKRGVVNRKDEVVIPFEYDNMLCVSDGRYLVQNNELWSLISGDQKDLSTRNFSDVGFNSSTTVRSNFFNVKKTVKLFMDLFDDKSCYNLTSDKTLSDFTHLLTLSEISYKDKYFLSEHDYSKGLDVSYAFSSPIARETYSYLYGMRFYDGTKFNYNSKLSSLFISKSIKDYPDDSEEKFVEEFEKQLQALGYTAAEREHYFKKNGHFVSIGYDDGNLTLIYSFNDWVLIDVDRNPRNKSGKLEEVEEVEEIAPVDSAVVETV